MVVCCQKTYAYMGYGESEMRTTVLEFEYSYGVEEYDLGTAFAQVLFTTWFICLVSSWNQHMIDPLCFCLPSSSSQKPWIVILLGKLEVPTLIDAKEFSNTLLQKERKIVPPPALKMWTRNLWFWNYVVCEQIAIGTNDVYKTSAAAQQAGAKIVREAGPLPGLDTKIVSCLDPDGWKTVSKLFGQYFQCRLIDSQKLQHVSQPWHFPF